MHCCVLQISFIQGTTLYPVSCRTLQFFAMSAMDVDHIEMYSPVAVVNFQRSGGSIVPTKILGPSERGAGYRQLLAHFVVHMPSCLHVLFPFGTRGGGGGKFGIGEIWHNKIVPNFAMEFLNSYRILPAPNFLRSGDKISPANFFFLASRGHRVQNWGP